METFQSRLQTALKIKGMKATDLAKLMHTGRSTVSQWVNGRNGVRSDSAYKIAEKLNINPSWLFGADVPFSTFEDANKQSESSVEDKILDRLSKMSEENKKYLLGYAEALISQQKRKNE